MCMDAGSERFVEIVNDNEDEQFDNKFQVIGRRSP